MRWETIANYLSDVRAERYFEPFLMSEDRRFESYVHYAIEALDSMGSAGEIQLIDINSSVSHRAWEDRYGLYHLELLRQSAVDEELFFRSIALCAQNIQFCRLDRSVRDYFMYKVKSGMLSAYQWDGCFVDELEQLCFDHVFYERRAIVNFSSVYREVMDEFELECELNVVRRVVLVLKCLKRTKQLSVLSRLVDVR